jgi:hypothetical protein
MLIAESPLAETVPPDWREKVGSRGLETDDQDRVVNFVWGGALGRFTRGVALPFAHVVCTGKSAKVEAFADRGTFTVHDDTTVAST